MTAAQHQHIAQRVKVGAIGLAIVVLLIVLAGAILDAVSRDRPAGSSAAKSDTAVNLALANGADATTEPLADMGVTPTTANVVAAR